MKAVGRERVAMGHLKQRFGYERPGHICKAKVAAGVSVCQLFVIESHERQQGRVQIVDVHLSIDRVTTELVGGTVRV